MILQLMCWLATPASQALHFGALYAPSQEPRLHSPLKDHPPTPFGATEINPRNSGL